MTILGRHAMVALVIAGGMLAGCRGGGDAEDAGPAVAVDTANKDWTDGLSATQVQEQAREMTPEQAAAAGVAVDTSIHMENLGNSDSAFVGSDDGADTIPRTSPLGDTSRAAGPSAPPRRP
ncbi:MAG TPA: hypothetical protein VFR81_28460 [Longimicrobium sp.]|nr:hypothetical protein [Longimicrobium sp.]